MLNERMYLSMFRNEPEVMTVTEASKLLRIGRNKTYRLVSDGTLGSIKVGGKIIIPKMSLVAFLTNENNYQFCNKIIPERHWTLPESCDTMCAANGDNEKITGS